MATMTRRTIYDKPLGAGFGTARMFCVAEMVEDATAPNEANSVQVRYGIALDAANPPLKFVEMPRDDFMAIRLLKNLAVP
jgi:hypothetical protein